MEVERNRRQRSRNHRPVHVLHEQCGGDDEGGQQGGAHGGRALLAPGRGRSKAGLAASGHENLKSTFSRRGSACRGGRRRLSTDRRANFLHPKQAPRRRQRLFAGVLVAGVVRLLRLRHVIADGRHLRVRNIAEFLLGAGDGRRGRLMMGGGEGRTPPRPCRSPRFRRAASRCQFRPGTGPARRGRRKPKPGKTHRRAPRTPRARAWSWPILHSPRIS